MAFKMFYELRTFHDNETHLLLAAPITSRERWASKKLLKEFVGHLGKKLLLPELFDVMLYELTCRTHREMTAKFA